MKRAEGVTGSVRSTEEPFYVDRRFYLAVLAGPVVCGVWWTIRPGKFLTSERIFSFWFLEMALLWPLAEEIVFRGLIQGWLSGKLAGTARSGSSARPRGIGITSANALTSLLFALAHVFQHSLMHGALVFFPSLVFGYFRDRDENLCPPVVLHCVYNASWFVAGLSALD